MRLALNSLAKHRFLGALVDLKIVLAVGNPLLLSALAYAPGARDHLVAAVTTEGESVEAVSELFAGFVIATDSLETGHGTDPLGRFSHLRTLRFLDSTSPAAIQEAVESGVDGILPLFSIQGDGSGGAIQAIAAVGKGGTWVPKTVSDAVDSADPEALELVCQLSASERSVLSAVGRVLDNIDIAEETMSPLETIKSHLKAIRQKMNISDREQLALVSIHAGL